MAKRTRRMRRDDVRPSLAEKWRAISREYPEAAALVSTLAQKLLAMDRIDSPGVARAIQSSEMQEMQRVLENNPHLRECLGLSSVSPRTILFAVDMYATDLLFDHEHHSGAA